MEEKTKSKEGDETHMVEMRENATARGMSDW